MATKVFASFVEMEKFINDKITKALMSASVKIRKQLRDIIDEQYYNDPLFSPNIYRRTNTFLDSASYKLIGKNMAEIGIDTDEMHYYNGFNPDQAVEWAANSMHGGEMYQTSTTDFWTVFEEWCDNNVIKILREELSSHGFNVTK